MKKVNYLIVINLTAIKLIAVANGRIKESNMQGTSKKLSYFSFGSF